jgi:hypothetical protein
MAYRIINEGKDHYQVLHPDGTRFTVPKKGISKEMHEKIKGMPKLYDGDGGLMSLDSMEKSSQVEKSNPSTPVDAEIESIQNRLNAGNSMNAEEAVPMAKKLEQLKMVQQGIIEARNTPRYISMPNEEPAKKEPTEPAETAPAENKAFGVADDVPSHMTTDEVSKGVKEEADKQAAEQAKQKLNQAPEKAPEAASASAMPPMESEIRGVPKINPYAGAQMMAKAAADYNTAVKRHEASLEQKDNEYQQAKKNDQQEMQDFINSHQIQQGHYWGSMTTGGKVMSGIALALGGMGAAMAKSQNYALQIINKAIEDDMEAQKENRNSGINALLQKGKDRDSVYANYRANTIQKIQDQNNLYTAQAKTAEAKQAGQALDMKLEEMKNQALVQADTRQAMNYIYTKGIPTKSIPTPLLMDDKIRQQLVDVDGTSYMYKGRPEGAEIHNKMEANFRPIRDAIVELKNMGPAALNKFSAEGQRARAIADMLPNAVAGFYSSAIDSKRISDTEGHRAESALSDPSSFLQAVIGDNVKGMTVLHEMQNIIDSSRKQMLSGYEETPRPAGSAGMPSGPQKLPLNKVK